MKTIAQDQKRTESLLQRRGIRLHDIQSFSFMKRFHEVPRKSNLKVKDKYGAGILTLRLKQGIQRAFYVHPFQKPSSSLQAINAVAKTAIINILNNCFISISYYFHL